MSETEGNEVRKEVLQVLNRLSDRYPQLRICQLVGNVLPAEIVDPYYLEDSELLKHLIAFEGKMNAVREAGERAFRKGVKS